MRPPFMVYSLTGKPISLYKAAFRTAAELLIMALVGLLAAGFFLSYSKAGSIQEIKSRFLIGDGLDEFPFRGPIWYHHIHGSLSIEGEADYDRFEVWAGEVGDSNIETRRVTDDPKDRHLGTPGDEYTTVEVRSQVALLRVQGFRSGRVKIDGWARPR